MHMYVWPLREVKSDRCLMCVGQVYYVWAGGGLVGAAAAIRWQLLWVTNLDRLPFRATFTPGFRSRARTVAAPLRSGGRRAHCVANGVTCKVYGGP